MTIDFFKEMVNSRDLASDWQMASKFSNPFCLGEHTRQGYH